MKGDKKNLSNKIAKVKSHKVILCHHLAPGDILMFSSMIRDVKILFPYLEIGYSTSANGLLDNSPNPYVIKLDPKKDDVNRINVGNGLINKCKYGFHMSDDFFLTTIITLVIYDIIDFPDRDKYDFELLKKILITDQFKEEFEDKILNAEDENTVNKIRQEMNETVYNIVYPFIRGISIFVANKIKNVKSNDPNFMSNRPAIFLNPLERRTRLMDAYPDVKRYWLVAAGGKSDAITKIWHWKSFQQVIDHFKGFITFVIIGKSDHILETRLRNCIYLVDKTSTRDLFSLTYHSDGVISGVSFLMHLAAGIRNYSGMWTPCVNIKGNREEPTYTLYDNHQVLHSYGGLNCSGCWKGKVTKEQKKKDSDRVCNRPVLKDGIDIPQCMADITVEDVIRAIEVYYRGDIYGVNLLDKMKKMQELKSRADYHRMKAKRFSS